MSPSAIAAPGAPGGEVNRELAMVRQATAKYHDVDVAIADGYGAIFPPTPHIRNHGAAYFNLDHLLDFEFVLTKPDALIYSLMEGDGPKLVAVEYFMVFLPPPEGFTGDFDVWHFRGHPGCVYTDGHEEPYPGGALPPYNPALCPETSPDGAPLAAVSPPGSTLHVWVWRANPDGVFAPTNPTVP